MEWKPIPKRCEAWRVTPHLRDYETACAGFSWESVRRELSGLPEGQGLNIAHEAVDRHATSDRRKHVAIRWLGRDGARVDLSYGELRWRTNRFANTLRQLGLSGPDPGALYRGAGNAQERQRILPPLLGLRARTDLPALG